MADFSNIQVHVSSEELKNFESGNERYLPIQMAHNPEIITYGSATESWFGLEARKVKINFNSNIFSIPLFGHTLGHCGVAIEQQNKWTLHVGDAYYLRVETEINDHPVTQLATMRADNNELRIESLNQIKRLIKDHSNEIEIFGYHDPNEFNSRTN